MFFHPDRRIPLNKFFFSFHADSVHNAYPVSLQYFPSCFVLFQFLLPRYYINHHVPSVFFRHVPLRFFFTTSVH